MPGGFLLQLEQRDNVVSIRDSAGTPESKLQARQASLSSSVPLSTSSSSNVPSSASSAPTSSASTLSTPATVSTTSNTGSRSITDELLPSGSSSPSTPPRNTLPQTVLMWIFAVIAVGVIGIIVIWRWSCIRMRRESRRAHRRSSRAALTRPDSHSPPSPLNISDMHFQNSWDRDTRPITLSPTFLHTGLTMPLVDSQGNMILPRRPRDRRVQALDVDAEGRRGGRPVGDDGEPDDGAFDELPAYDGDKAPPGYQTVTLEHVNELLSQRTRPGSRQQQRSVEAHAMPDLPGSSPSAIASSSTAVWRRQGAGTPTPPGAVTPSPLSGSPPPAATPTVLQSFSRPPSRPA